uniref:hypothetical protein n=1 Tax=Arthrobacter sp. TaxID=1667 RepID=UPI000EB746EF|nr:hypothetical protein [Arthrobacter sp.]AXV46189.1 hypothetical protein pA19BH1_p16 [Arthrobacter sp.]
MTAQPGNTDDRQVVPRWRTFKRTLDTRELASLHLTFPESVDGELEPLRMAFARDQSLYTAADLLNALVADGRHDAEVSRLSTFITDLPEAPATLASIIAQLRGKRGPGQEIELPPNSGEDPSQSDASRRVRQLRELLGNEPRNAVRWVDVALAHATLGVNNKAQREMLVALALAPESRFVLRSAARLFVHLNDPERANSVLRQSQRLRSDPWLLAAELSTSQLAFGRFHNERSARELLVSENLSPHSLSELASELGTNELRSGRDRRARKLFDLALQEPTENAVAQATSVAEEGDLRLDPKLLAISHGFEARAIDHSRRGEWNDAATEGHRWLLDQPFALEPALFTSYAASVGAADFELALSVALTGIRTHPTNAMLHNNAAFALANLDKTAVAREHLAFAPDTQDDEDSAVHRATLGLVLFREGRDAEGRAMYVSAIESLGTSKRQDMAAVATSFWAMEETRIFSSFAEQATKKAIQLSGAHPSPAGDALVKRLGRLDGIDLRGFPIS